MKNVLSLYYQDLRETPGNFNALVEEIESMVREAMTPAQTEYFEQVYPGSRLVTLDVLEDALGKGAEHISSMRNGNETISTTTMRALELLHRAVRADPSVAVEAIEDYIERTDAAEGKEN